MCNVCTKIERKTDGAQLKESPTRTDKGHIFDNDDTNNNNNNINNDNDESRRQKESDDAMRCDAADKAKQKHSTNETHKMPKTNAMATTTATT